MAHARICLAIGNIDGANKVFRTPVPYVPGSTGYILNGTIHGAKAAQDPSNPFSYVESNPDAGEITVNVAPLTDDVVQIFFWDRLIEPAPALTQLVGVVHPPQKLQGVVSPVTPPTLTGVVKTTTIRGVIRAPAVDQLVGVKKTGRIVGVIKEC